MNKPRGKPALVFKIDTKGDIKQQSEAIAKAASAYRERALKEHAAKKVRKKK